MNLQISRICWKNRFSTFSNFIRPRWKKNRIYTYPCCQIPNSFFLKFRSNWTLIRLWTRGQGKTSRRDCRSQKIARHKVPSINDVIPETYGIKVGRVHFFERLLPYEHKMGCKIVVKILTSIRHVSIWNKDEDTP